MPGLDVFSLSSSVDVIGEIVVVDPVFCSRKMPEERWGMSLDHCCVFISDRQTLVVDPNLFACVALSDEFFMDSAWAVCILFALAGLEHDCVFVEWCHSHQLVKPFHDR